MNTDNRIRDVNYDLCRIFSCILVILFHLNSPYFDMDYSKKFWGEVYSNNLEYVYFYEAISEMAVPVFFMITGCFLLNNYMNKNISYFYKKSFIKFGIPTIIFSLLYLFISIFREILNKSLDYKEPLMNFLKGCPFSHLWFMYTLFGVYLLIPFIVTVKEKLGEKTFGKVCLFYSIIALMSGLTSIFYLHWSIAKVSCYLGFVFLGYLIKQKITSKKRSNKKAIIYICLCLVISVFVTYITYGFRSGFTDNTLLKIITKGGFFSPLNIINSCFLFTAFSYMRISINNVIPYLAKYTFYIYLIHELFVIAYCHAIRQLFSINHDCRISVLVGVVIVFVLSLFSSMIYNKTWKFLDNKFYLSERLSEKIFHESDNLNEVLKC